MAPELTQARIFPFHRPTTAATWSSITLVNCALSLTLLTHPANCECQTSVCPLSVILFATA